MVDEVKQPLSAVKQGIPGDPGVTVSIPGLPSVSGEDKISGEVELSADLGLDLRPDL